MSYLLFTNKIQLSGLDVSLAVIPSDLSLDNRDLYTTGANGRTTPRSWISPESKKNVNFLTLHKLKFNVMILGLHVIFGCVYSLVYVHNVQCVHEYSHDKWQAMVYKKIKTLPSRLDHTDIISIIYIDVIVYKFLFRHLH